MNNLKIRKMGPFWMVGLLFFVAHSGFAQQKKLCEAENYHDRLLVDTTIQLIDVRTPIETAEGTISGAILLNWKDSIAFELGVQKLDKRRPVYIYCRSGNRSSEAADYLTHLGFQEVVDLKGGIRAWEEKGYFIGEKVNKDNNGKGCH